MRLAHLGVLAASFSALALARGDGHGPKTARTAAMADNPFMQPSTLAFELPPFDRIRDSDYLPAFQAGMREQLTEVARIAHNPQPATFDNTIVALERAGQLLQRVDAAFGRLNACNTNPRMQEIDTEMAPKLTALQNTTNQPLLAQLTNRALRERIYKASIARASGGATDNTAVIAQLVKLRAERAALLGYANHAAYQLEDESAGSPAAVRDMISQVAPAALARARAEAADIQTLIDTQARLNGPPSFTLQPWDWSFYAQQVRKARYDFDQARVAPYFELDHVLQDGVFYAAHQLYGLSFKERRDLPVYQPDVRVFEVFDGDGAPLALFLADYFARDNKQGGAWMAAYVTQSQLLHHKPVVANHLNIPKPQAGQPVLLTFDEVTAMFHEFGHALPGMLSSVRYPKLAGTAVPRDFVEYPSQYNEMWAREPSVVAHYARHYQSGEPMQPELLEKVLAAQKFNQGYATTEYLAAALLDQAWHQISAAQAPSPAEVPAFEQAALRDSGLDYSPVPPRYHSTYFSHIFESGYSAGYYAYLWSEVLARDTGQWFHTHGGLTRANGDYLRTQVLSRGRSEDPQVLFRNFYGRAPEIAPLLEYRGLAGGS